MAKIVIHHTHTQSDATVRAAIDTLLNELQREYQIAHQWNGNTVHCHRSGASGTLTLHHHVLDIEIKLSMMLSMFEKRIRDTIADFCRTQLP